MLIGHTFIWNKRMFIILPRFLNESRDCFTGSRVRLKIVKETTPPSFSPVVNQVLFYKISYPRFNLRAWDFPCL